MIVCEKHPGTVVVCEKSCQLCDLEIRVRVLEQENNDLQDANKRLQEDLEGYIELDRVLDETNKPLADP